MHVMPGEGSLWNELPDGRAVTDVVFGFVGVIQPVHQGFVIYQDSLTVKNNGLGTIFQMDRDQGIGLQIARPGGVGRTTKKESLVYPDAPDGSGMGAPHRG